MPRERTFRTEAIVVKRRNFGEADRLLTLYTREFGKLQAIAKGARKPQSRKTGHVELLMRSRFLLAEGRDLHIITQAEMIEAYPALRGDLVRTTYASYLVELLDRFTVEGDSNQDIYHLLVEALRWLSETDDVRLPTRIFELRLLGLTGFQPQLFQCVSCDAPIQEQDQFFSAELGGLLCPHCRQATRSAKPISAVAVKVLRYLQTRPWEIVKSLHLKRPLHVELEAIMHHYLTFILERNLKSIDFLNRLREEAALFSQSAHHISD
ncbi:MAG: DNA repair protein RecO [Chloroflexi bacterium]|nr:MAG: DNA repair protein RecO [Chloroflexota bacterium]